VDFLRGKVDMGKLLQARGVAGVVRSDEALLPGDHPYFWAPFVVIGDRR
jgi:CHAT domain-containing protein